MRPVVYQGPSWSWTSVNSPIGFGSVLWDDDIHGFQSSAMEKSTINGHNDLDMSYSIRPPTPHWEILDVKADLVDDAAPFGAVNHSRSSPSVIVL
jgi:hypothetical protein